jgi:predicted ATPase
MIHSIRIRNFKSFEDVHVDFSSFTAIVGLNAAGKTNIVNAVVFLQRLAVGDSTAEIFPKMATVPRELFYRFNTSNEFSFEISLEKDSKKYRYSIGVAQQEKPGESQPQLIVSRESLVIYESDVEIKVYERDRNKLRDSQNKEIPLSIDATQAALQYNNNETRAVRLLLRSIRIPSPAVIDSRDVIANAVSGGLGGLLVRLKETSPSDYVDFEKISKNLVPSFGSIVDTAFGAKSGVENSEPFQDYLILYKEKNISESLSMRALSTGDIRTLYLLASILNLRKHGTLIIEEVENGIHPKRAADLISHLENISRIRETQVIFTTHSPLIIDSLKPANVVFVSKDGTSGTKVLCLKEQKRLTHVQEVLREGGKLTDYINAQLG